MASVIETWISHFVEALNSEFTQYYSIFDLSQATSGPWSRIGIIFTFKSFVLIHFFTSSGYQCVSHPSDEVSLKIRFWFEIFPNFPYHLDFSCSHFRDNIYSEISQGLFFTFRQLVSHVVIWASMLLLNFVIYHIINHQFSPCASSFFSTFVGTLFVLSHQ